MAAEPSVGEPKAYEVTEENPDLDDEGEESDDYELEDDPENDNYRPEEEDDDDDAYGEGEGEPENLTAELLGNKRNGAYAEEDEEDDNDDEYHDDEEDAEGTAENPINVSGVAGSKRGVDELAEGDDAEGEQEEEETVAKKARV